MSQELMERLRAGQATPEDHAKIALALDDHERLEAVRAGVAGLDWMMLLKALLPALAAIPGLGPFVAIAQAVLSLFKVTLPSPEPSPAPAPVDGGGTVVPTPI